MDGTEFAALNAFVEVAERGNFARAAAHLGIVPSTISQTIRTLEERLGVRLFNRTTRSVALTEAGEKLLARVRPAITELAAAVDGVNEFRDTPTGTLRLLVSSAAAHIVLAPILKAFLNAYPAIVLDLSADDGRTDTNPATSRYDAGIRVGRRIARDMQTVRVSDASGLVAIASPAYLASHPPIHQPQDLQEHNCIRQRLGGQILPWEFANDAQRMEVAVHGSLIVDNAPWMVRAALEGIGVGYTIEAYVAEEIATGRLVPLLKDWSAEHHSYYLYYSGRQQLPVPLKVFIVFLRQR